MTTKINRHIVILLMAVCLFISCDSNIVYHQFQHTAQEGWDARDSITFVTDTVREDGTYTSYLCLRAAADYPYQNFCVVTKQMQPDGTTASRWLNIRIKEPDGQPDGNGAVLYTQEIPLHTMQLQQGDSLRITVAHHMKREVIQGIKDVGVKLIRNE